jgi:CRP-like cAMP-binding protein
VYCASRYFAPHCGIDEDPVTGSAHCTIIPYWAAKLGKDSLHARQVSARGGDLWCRLAGDRVLISGYATLYMTGELFGEMASIMGERERTARAVTASTSVIDVIDSGTMQRKLAEADPVLRALVRNLTTRLADANLMNEERWLFLNVYQSLAPEEIERP